MRVFVDPEVCRQHGQCEIAAPEVFQLDERGRLVYDQQPPDELGRPVEEAVDACPEQAISVLAPDTPLIGESRRIRV